MSQAVTPHYLVAVIGAGPAGLFAARQLANEGATAILINRDIKPGGLAEYGIYPDKHKMKEGLRAQFRQILTTPNVEYYGNLSVGEAGDLKLADLREMGFQAVLITVGAQGTKWLGLPGEELTGVYHAKDLVYHYNRLPPCSQQEFAIGRRVAVVGVGNVMLDLAHYLIDKVQVDEVIAVARRGPAEVKFTKNELENVAANLDLAALEEEIRRVTPAMRAVGQDPDQPRAFFRSVLDKAGESTSPTRFRLAFLATPVRILGNGAGRVSGLEVEETALALQDGEVKARGTGHTRRLDVDTVIFAIGDCVDAGFGLPVAGTEFVKNPEPRYPVEGNSHEAFDPATGAPIEGVFVAGWSRKASTGLVGVARKDGTNGARAVLQYLQTLPAAEPLLLEAVHARLVSLPGPVVTLADLRRLEEVEREQARLLGLEEFKFASNPEMLEAMRLVPAHVHPVG